MLKFRDICNEIEHSYLAICKLDKIDELINILQKHKNNYIKNKGKRINAKSQ